MGKYSELQDPDISVVSTPGAPGMAQPSHLITGNHTQGLDVGGQRGTLDTQAAEPVLSSRLPQEPESEPAAVWSIHPHLPRQPQHATTESLHSPAPLEMTTHPWLRELMDHMGGRVSAVTVWKALRENSNSQLQRLEVDSPQAPLPDEFYKADRDKGWGHGHLRRLIQVRHMFHKAQLNQAYTVLLLANNPLPQLSDPQGQCGPRLYLHQETGYDTDGGLHRATGK
ncbi:hypothetical protein AGOR_G00138130 [Albula goreensis]|uniref:Uncharacterized protein n=1 Tax=Albula goreensis TaxID=1534307 RepID=A0A8T3DEG1_9TELE|nr:hypothetical protein AGOR_G00138130 [Albula goreensis]